MSTSYLFSHDGLHDSLTHLYAPSFIYEVIDRRLKSAERNKSSILLIKVVLMLEKMEEKSPTSHYEKSIVDCADVLSSTLRPDDMVGRMGIFEFLIVLAPEKEGSGYDEAFKRIVERCENNWRGSIQLRFAMVESQEKEKISTLLDRLDAELPS